MNEVAREQTIKPLTAVLIRPKRMSDLPGLHRERNVSADTQAVLPSGVILTIFNMMAVAQEALTMIHNGGRDRAALCVRRHNSATQERRREIATMRALGARRATVLGIVLLESGTLAAAGGIVGIIGGHGAAILAAAALSTRSGLVTEPFVFALVEPVILAAVVLWLLATIVSAGFLHPFDITEYARYPRFGRFRACLVACILLASPPAVTLWPGRRDRPADFRATGELDPGRSRRDPVMNRTTARRSRSAGSSFPPGRPICRSSC